MRIYENPNGFAVVVLWESPDGSAERIHAWGDHVSDTDIHQHRGDYDSEILEGSCNEEIWEYEDDISGDWERLTVNCLGDSGSGYKVKIRDRVRCRVTVKELLTHKAGEAYTRKATDLHRIFPVKLPLVTRVNFGRTYNEIHTMIRKMGA